jgi:superfamily II DNA or RNA helicase
LIPQPDLIRLLDELERREFELIGWGDTNVCFSTDELEDVIQSVLPDYDPEDVEDELRDRVMITPVLDGRNIEVGVRTRMAEAMHLYRNLRQWFVGQDLIRTSTLVSDYRFVRQGRQYPKRDVDIAPLIEQWQQSFLKHASTKNALRDLVGDFKLSGFQTRATAEILSAWEDRRAYNKRSSATIICAGTGSGKTMAFYLPALSALSTDILGDATPRVRILAIYPRKELLKDQFNETWEQARKLDEKLLATGARKIRIGALFGETPSSATYALKKDQEFLHFRLLKCATNDCQGEMRWSRSDIQGNRERLVCNSCGHIVSSDEVSLTRNSAAKTPPDILFTTTEMLNQRMSDARLQHLFGIGCSTNLPLVLLDEVHTYGGSQGAQTALLLRRWTRLSRNRPHFVGLSATLRDASNFFATLTGVNRSRVGLVEPSPEEMIEEGAEYLLALRGDPVSKTALLSTTIQAAMLTRRILDHSDYRKAKGVWGCKTFIFTDDLDVNNRLYSTLADAEGWQQRKGGLEPNPNGPLAQLRNSSTTQESTRTLRNFGQDWSVSKASGFSLDGQDRSRIARTSSQDTGYDHEAEIVVTTASLEVGFNDPDVGAVIQHKSPRGVAAYLQRKGRAGRQRFMRPWMIVVLSDFGRDRVTYQQYENLIDPQIKLQRLPVDNIHILKMQGAQAVLDWLGQKIADSRIWYWLNKPEENTKGTNEVLKHVESVMTEGDAQDNLRDYIGSALGLTENALERVLWQAPRSIFLEFLPTLHRQLTSRWGAWSDAEQRIIDWVELARGTWHSPVPEFIPGSSFSDLDAPELQIRLDRRGSEEWQGMPYFQGLKEYAPGRISKRYAIASGAISDWLVPRGYEPTPGERVEQHDIEDAFGSNASLIASVPVDGSDGLLEIYQPGLVQPSSLFADRTVADTSNAFLRWHSKFTAPEDGFVGHVPASSNWADKLIGVTFFTHSMMSPVEVTRYNTGSNAEIRLRDGQSAQVQFDWVHQGKNVAIGARQFMDGTRFDFRVSASDLSYCLNQPELGRALRTQYFQDSLREASVFNGNQFTADWVFECCLAAIALDLSQSDHDLNAAIAAVCDGDSVVPLEQVPKFLFQLDSQGESGTDGAPDNQDESKEQKLQKELAALLIESEIRETIRQTAKCLYESLSEDPDARIWASVVLGNTLAAAVHQSICVLLPNVDDRSIHTDIELDPDNLEGITVWVSEVESGGMGVITQLQEAYSEDPVKVLNVFYQCLQPGAYEQLDNDLYEALTEVSRQGDLARAIEDVRFSSSYKERLDSTRNLRSMLSERGFIVSHTFSTVLNSRVLRAGSSAATDARLLEYLNLWREIEAKAGLELPMNIAATILGVGEVSANDPAIAFERACEIQSMLWVRGNNVRDAALKFFNPFHIGNTRTERLIGASICEDNCRATRYEKDNWLAHVHHAIDTDGQVDLVLQRSSFGEMTSIVATLHVSPIESRGLTFFPRVRSVIRRGNELRLRIELAEVFS